MPTLPAPRPVLALLLPACFASAALGHGGAWYPSQLISHASGEGAENRYFGRAMALSEGRLIVGAPGLDGGTGAAYVFEAGVDGWSQSAELVPPGGGVESFGRAVAIHRTIAAVASPKEERVHVFELAGSTWTLVAELVPTVPDVDFGEAVACTEDTVFVGAPNADEVALFRRQLDGSFAPAGSLVASVEADELGECLAVDGGRLVAGAPGSSLAVVFERTGDTWAEGALLAPQAGAVDEFPSAAAICGDRVLLGASAEDGQDGAAHVYERVGGSWATSAVLRPPTTTPGAEFGEAVALSSSTALVGAPADDGGLGRAHVFQFTGNEWEPLASLALPLDQGEVRFAEAVCLDGVHALLNVGLDEVPIFGAPGVTYSGSVHVWGPSYPSEPLLYAYPKAIGVGNGGQQGWMLSGGTALADLPYVLLGSASGTEPGIPLAGGAVLPLAWDDYTAFTLTQPNHGPLVGSFGVLDADGAAVGSLTLPEESPAELAGLTLHHAFVVLDPGAPEWIVGHSGVALLHILP